MKRFLKIAALSAALLSTPTIGWSQNGAAPAKKAVGNGPAAPLVVAPAPDIAPDADCGPGCQVPANCERCSTFGIFGDYLHLKARGTTVPYGQIQDGVGPLAVPRGAVGSLNGDYASGVRVGGFLALTGDTKLSATFTHYDAESDNRLNVPVGQPFVIRSLTVFPTTVNAAADSLAAQAKMQITFQNVDVDFTKYLAANDCHRIAMIIGGRYAHLDQDFRGDYSILGATSVTTGLQFDGGGPRVGLESEFSILPGLWIYSKGAFSLLFGGFEASYLQQNAFAGEQARTNFTDERWVPVMEFEAGIGWRNCNERIGIMAGYHLSAWYNTVTTPTWIQGVQNGNFAANGNNLSNTLTFDGFFARLELRF